MTSELTIWQPIETAPKDGSRILLFIPRQSSRFYPGWGGYPLIGQWQNNEESTDGYWAYSVNERKPLKRQPTLWMPLAAPPIKPSEYLEEKEK